MLILFDARQDALKAPALVPTNKSKMSETFFPISASSFCKKTTPAIALTPPPSKDRTFLMFPLSLLSTTGIASKFSMLPVSAR